MATFKSKLVTFVGRRVLPDFIKKPLARQRWRHRLARENKDWNQSRLDGERLVHVLHVGKTGGTAIRHALRDLPLVNGFRFILHPHHMTLGGLNRIGPFKKHPMFFLGP